MTTAKTTDSTARGRDDSGKLSFTSALLFLLGVGFLVIGVVEVARERETLGWPSAEGRILSSEVTHETTQQTNSASGRPTTHTRYRAQVAYEFTVEGRSLRSDHVFRFEADWPRPDEAEEIVRRYPRGRLVPVYYDPDDPGTSVLVNGVGRRTYSPIGLGGILLLVAAGMKLWARS